jgi:hypothetical protein
MAYIRVRAGENPLQVWGSVKQRATLQGDPCRIRPNDAMPLSKLVAKRIFSIQMPEMIAIPGMPNKLIMADEVPVCLFRHLMSDYIATGFRADGFYSILNDKNRINNAQTFINIFDCREFVKRLREATGRDFMIQQYEEWEAACGLLKGKNWTWSETLHEGKNVLCVLDATGCELCYFSDPDFRDHQLGLRLVENI